MRRSDLFQNAVYVTSLHESLFSALLAKAWRQLCCGPKYSTNEMFPDRVSKIRFVLLKSRSFRADNAGPSTSSGQALKACSSTLNSEQHAPVLALMVMRRAQNSGFIPGVALCVLIPQIYIASMLPWNSSPAHHSLILQRKVKGVVPVGSAHFAARCH